MSAAPAFVGTLQTPVQSFANGDGTTVKTLVTPGLSGCRVDTLFASNTDAAVATVLQLSIQVSAVEYVIGEVTVPAGAGTNGSTKSVALLNPTDIPGLTYTENGALYLASGALLRAKAKVSVAGGNIISVTGVAGNY